MTKHNKNLTRVLAILTTDVDEFDVCFKAGNVIVRGQNFDPQVDDDREVLEILMADKEFGFSVSTIENLAKELRELQRVWFDAAENLGFSKKVWCPTAEKALALHELEQARRIIDRHIDSGFAKDIGCGEDGYFEFFYDPKHFDGKVEET